MTEEWRTCPEGWNDYEVSNLGRVRRVGAAKGAVAGRILSTKKLKRGYPAIALCSQGRYRVWRVHALVALAFIGPRGDGMTVNHKDGNKLNNKAENLEWVTLGDNSRHGWQNGLMRVVRGQERSVSKLTDEIVREARLLARSVSIRSLARRYGVHHKTLGMAISGKNWGHVLPPPPKEMDDA